MMFLGRVESNLIIISGEKKNINSQAKINILLLDWGWYQSANRYLEEKLFPAKTSICETRESAFLRALIIHLFQQFY